MEVIVVRSGLGLERTFCRLIANPEPQCLDGWAGGLRDVEVKFGARRDVAGHGNSEGAASKRD